MGSFFLFFLRKREMHFTRVSSYSWEISWSHLLLSISPFSASTVCGFSNNHIEVLGAAESGTGTCSLTARNSLMGIWGDGYSTVIHIHPLKESRITTNFKEFLSQITDQKSEKYLYCPMAWRDGRDLTRSFNPSFSI